MRGDFSYIKCGLVGVSIRQGILIFVYKCDNIYAMRLLRISDKALMIITVFMMSAVFGAVAASQFKNDTFADSENGVFVESEEYFVTFYDEGNRLTVKTSAETVGEALERVGIVVNPSDIVEPAADTKITTDNFFVNIHRSRPVLVKSGVEEKYIMTASYNTRAIAEEAGFTVYDGDEIRTVPSGNFLESGVASAYEVIRNGGRMVTEEVEIPFTEETVRDVNLENGKSEVRQLGEVGMKKVYYEALYVDDKEVSREVVREEVVREPVARIVAVGAKKSLPPGSDTCANWARQAGVSEADINAAIDLIYHESGCRFDAANSRTGAYGIPQALPGSKMASAGSDWQTNPVTQIRWMAGYVKGRYGGWSEALSFWYGHGWY